MKKYLISIEYADSPRLQSFFAQPTFSRYQSDFTQFGIIGAELPTKEYFRLGVSGNPKPLSPAELGCTLSHIQALKDFLASNEKYICVFEDDAVAIKDIDLNALKEKIDRLNLTMPFFLSLGGIQLSSNRRVRGIFLDNELEGKKVLKIHPVYLGRFCYAYAYILDRKMAELLIKYHESPQCYDSWSKIMLLNPSCTFYATYLFDHPDLGDELLAQSYLEEERQLMKNKVTVKKTVFQRWKVSLLKYFHKLFLKRYQDS